MKTWLFVMSVWTITSIALAGCAHPTGRIYVSGCEEPESRAAKFGTVLECTEHARCHPMTGCRPAADCLVSTPRGDETHTFPVCR